jgi:hypothetical protein
MKTLIGLAAAAITVLPLPALAGSWRDINELSQLVRAAGTEIVNTECSDNMMGSYQYDPDSGIDRLTICTNKVDMKDPDAVWETLSHEATHVAQACIGENVYKDTYLPRIFRSLRTEAPHYARLLDSYSQRDRLREAEAFYSELQLPSVVKTMVIKACDIESTG